MASVQPLHWMATSVQLTQDGGLPLLPSSNHRGIPLLQEGLHTLGIPLSSGQTVQFLKVTRPSFCVGSKLNPQRCLFFRCVYVSNGLVQLKVQPRRAQLSTYRRPWRRTVATSVQPCKQTRRTAATSVQPCKQTRRIAATSLFDCSHIRMCVQFRFFCG